MKQQAIDNINKKIEKYSKMVEKSEKIYKGNESKYTFHGGASYGYEKGKLGAYEDMKDELQALGDGWIPVTLENLPEESLEVLTYSFGLYILAYHIGGDWFETGGLQPLQKIEYYRILSLPPNK